MTDIIKKDITRRRYEQLKRLYRQQRKLGIPPGRSIDFVVDFTGMRFTTVYRILLSIKMLGKENS